MQITANSTGMQAGVTGATDKEGREYAVVVVKGTYIVDSSGEVRLADKQQPLIYADAHHGDPGATSIKYECDFAPFKPTADVLVNGFAVSPRGNLVEQLTVSLEVGPMKKHLRVVGDRRWEAGIQGTRPTPPTPFAEMPLLFERAFGGSDRTHVNSEYHGTEMRNPVGVGYHRNSEPRNLDGRALPNIEYPDQLLSRWNDIPTPAGFATIGRGWQPRVAYAGTYDKAWLDDKFPFLPGDFDERYFQSAPADQQMPELTAKMAVRCTNMSAGGLLAFAIPQVTLPLMFRFRDRDAIVEPRLDTLLIEPDKRSFLLVWRARVAVGRKFSALREIRVGPRRGASPSRRVRRFASLAEVIDWRMGR
jgi:hypothetical protein